MFSTYKVTFYTTTYRYHVKRQDIGQPIRLIITPHIQWNSSVPERSLQLASLLQLTNWWTGQVRPTTFAQCRVLTAGQDTRAVALYANNKRTRVTSKLALWFFYHSRTALVVRGVCTTWFSTKLYAHSMRYR